MPFRVKRSIKVGGAKVNIGKRGASSVTVGRTNIGKKGVKTTVPTGIKGVSYQTKANGCAVIGFAVLALGAASCARSMATPGPAVATVVPSVATERTTESSEATSTPEVVEKTTSTTAPTKEATDATIPEAPTPAAASAVAGALSLDTARAALAAYGLSCESLGEPSGAIPGGWKCLGADVEAFLYSMDGATVSEAYTTVTGDVDAIAPGVFAAIAGLTWPGVPAGAMHSFVASNLAGGETSLGGTSVKVSRLDGLLGNPAVLLDVTVP